MEDDIDNFNPNLLKGMSIEELQAQLTHYQRRSNKLNEIIWEIKGLIRDKERK